MTQGPTNYHKCEKAISVTMNITINLYYIFSTYLMSTK